MREKKLFKHWFNVMGCPCQLQLYCHDKKQFSQVKLAVLKELSRLDNYYTNYSENSFTSQINRSAGCPEGIQVDEETAALLDYSRQCHIHSGGLFDITAGTLRKVWNYQSPVPKLPTPEDVDQLMDAVGWDKVMWQKPFLQLPIPGMVIDFGGVVKEYAADVAAGICYQHNIFNGFINLSGDMRVLGPHANGKPWCLGIRNPIKPDKDIAYVFLQGGAIATSGNYERCIRVDGQVYSHIINPKTGWPVMDAFPSISILGDHCLVAGSAATIASLKNKADALAWLDELGLPYICVDEAGKIHKNCCDTVSN